MLLVKVVQIVITKSLNILILYQWIRKAQGERYILTFEKPRVRGISGIRIRPSYNLIISQPTFFKFSGTTQISKTTFTSMEPCESCSSTEGYRKKLSRTHLIFKHVQIRNHLYLCVSNYRIDLRNIIGCT